MKYFLLLSITLGIIVITACSNQQTATQNNPNNVNQKTMSSGEECNTAQDCDQKGQTFIMSQPHKAKTYFEKALKYDPNDKMALMGLANIYAQLGDSTKATEYEQKASMP